MKKTAFGVLAFAVFLGGSFAFAQDRKPFSDEQYILMDMRLSREDNLRVTGRFATVQDAYRNGLFARFINYTQVDSQSKEDGTEFPMNDNLRATAALLTEELRLVLANRPDIKLHLSQDQYIYVQIPSNLKHSAPVLGFSCHYDTTPEIDGSSIRPVVHKNYNGGDIVINQEKGLVINPKTDPYLAKLVGKTIVTSDGNTMLSGDDKAGVAIVMTLIQTLADHPDIKHGPLQFVITPNEDIGMSADRLELAYYKPDISFDFDGGVDGEIMVENFTAEGYKITFKGRAAHPYEAKAKDMLDPYQVGSSFVASLPEEYWPQHSEGREPYFHVYDMQKQGADIVVSGRLRYFDQEDGRRMERMVAQKADSVAQALRTQVDIHSFKQYENVSYGVHPKAKEIAVKAARAAGVTPRLVSERAGTTTAMMMAKWGFSGYTLFTGQVNPHAYTEWLSEDDMFKAYKTGLNIVREVSQMQENL